MAMTSQGRKSTMGVVHRGHLHGVGVPGIYSTAPWVVEKGLIDASLSLELTDSGVTKDGSSVQHDQ